MTDQLLRKLNEEHPLNIVIDIDVVEDQTYYRELLFELLRLHNLKEARPFVDPDEYKQKLNTEPNFIPHMALLDYKYDGSQLNGNDLTEFLISRADRLKLPRPIIFMITGWNEVEVVKDFYEMGGFTWIDKDARAFKEVFKSKVNKGLNKIYALYDDLAFYEDLEEN